MYVRSIQTGEAMTSHLASWIVLAIGAIVSAALVVGSPDDVGVKVLAMTVLWLSSVVSVRMDLAHPFVWLGGAGSRLPPGREYHPLRIRTTHIPAHLITHDGRRATLDRLVALVPERLGKQTATNRRRVDWGLTNQAPEPNARAVSHREELNNRTRVEPS